MEILCGYKIFHKNFSYFFNFFSKKSEIVGSTGRKKWSKIWQIVFLDIIMLLKTKFYIITKQKMAKRPQRTPEQQEYRDKLAHNLKELRNCGDTWRDLAQTLHDKEQATDKYIEALGEWRKLSKEKSKELAEKLMAEKPTRDEERKSMRWLVENIDKFQWLDYKEVAEKAMKIWMWGKLAKNLEKFKWLDHKELVKKWMASRSSDEDRKWLRLINDLEKFTWLDDNDRKDIAEKFLLFCNHQVIKNPDLRSPIVWNYEYRGWEILVKNIDKFKWLWLDYKAITEKLMKKWYWEDVGYYIDKFKWLWLDSKWIGKKLMEYWYSDYLVSILDSKLRAWELCEWLDRKKLAEKAMEDGEWVYLAYNFQKFKWLWLDQEVIVEWVIKEIEKEAERSKHNMERFPGLVGDRRSLWWDALTDNLDKFEWLNYQKIAERIMNDDFWPVAENLEKFEWLDKEIANRLIKAWYYKEVAKNLDKFEWLDKEIAKELIKRWEWESVVDHQEKFEWLNGEIGNIFIEFWQWDYIAKHPEKFWLKKEK